MSKKIFFVRLTLFLGLFFSILFSAYSIYYKIHFLDFSFTQQKKTPVWTIEAHLNFKPVDNNVRVVFSKVTPSDNFKILDESIIAKGYNVEETEDNYIVKSTSKKLAQDIYYRTLIYDMKALSYVSVNNAPEELTLPILDDEMMRLAQEIILLSQEEEGDAVQKILTVVNKDTPNEIVHNFIPERSNLKEKAERVIDLLAINGISSKLIRGVKLAEEKKAVSPDVMLEVYDQEQKQWVVYDIETGIKGFPDNFIAFQRGKNSLVDVSGGVDSTIKYSVQKSLNSSFSMAKHRAKNLKHEKLFSFSIYNLPIEQQNALKWLTVFPLAIFIIVIFHNK